MSHLGSRIREYRLSKNFKVKKFAELIGISQGSLSDIENEKTNPSAETLESIVRNTDIDIYWLFTGDRKTEPLLFIIPEEKSYVEGLLKVLRGKNRANAEAIKLNVTAFAKSADLDIPEDSEEKQKAGQKKEA